MSRALVAVIAVGMLGAASAVEPITFEVTAEGGAAYRPTSDLVGTRVAPQFGIEAAVVRAAPRRDDLPICPIGIAIGMRIDGISDSRGASQACSVGIVFSIWRWGAHDLRLTFGPDVITADRSGDGVYRHDTAVGFSDAIDYRWWLHDGDQAIGVRLATDVAIVDRAGVRRSIGGSGLSLILTGRF